MEKLIEIGRLIWEGAARGTPAWRIGITLAIVLPLLWETGTVGIMGTHGFAWADDEGAYHTRMSLEMLKLNEAVTDLATQLKAADLQRAEADARRAQEAKDVTIRQLRRQIFETEHDGCNAKTDDMRNLLLGQAQQLRGDYQNLARAEYPPFTGCAAYR